MSTQSPPAPRHRWVHTGPCIPSFDFANLNQSFGTNAVLTQAALGPAFCQLVPMSRQVLPHVDPANVSSIRASTDASCGSQASVSKIEYKFYTWLVTDQASLCSPARHGSSDTEGEKRLLLMLIATLGIELLWEDSEGFRKTRLLS